MEAGVVKCTTMLAGPEKRVESAGKHATELECDEKLKQNVTYLISRHILFACSFERMTSRKPYGRPKTVKPILRNLLSILMLSRSFVPINLHGDIVITTSVMFCYVASVKKAQQSVQRILQCCDRTTLKVDDISVT